MDYARVSVKRCRDERTDARSEFAGAGLDPTARTRVRLENEFADPDRIRHARSIAPAGLP
jgi:hypothetical protein